MKVDFIGLESNWLLVKTEHFEVHSFVSHGEDVWAEPLIDTAVYTIRPATIEDYKKEVEFVEKVLALLNERTGKPYDGYRSNELVKGKIEELLND